MSARFEAVIATRVPRATERALRDLARQDDRSLAQYLRRTLMALARDTSADGSTGDGGDPPRGEA